MKVRASPFTDRAVSSPRRPAAYLIRAQHAKGDRDAHRGYETTRRRTLLLTLLGTSIAGGSCLELAGAAVASAPELPDAYAETALSLVKTLREAIEADLDGLPEYEVRRKADPAKDLVKTFMTRWKDVPIVKEDPSYAQLIQSIQELGQFYQKNGQRARMNLGTGRSILDHLDAAEAALPEREEPKKFPF